MTTEDDCLQKAVAGDEATVCFEPFGWTLENKARWRPAAYITTNQFTFPIIGNSYGMPVVGVIKGDTTDYGFTHNRSGARYDSKYTSTYLLCQQDIKTVRIYKKK